MLKSHTYKGSSKGSYAYYEKVCMHLHFLHPKQCIFQFSFLKEPHLFRTAFAPEECLIPLLSSSLHSEAGLPRGQGPMQLGHPLLKTQIECGAAWIQTGTHTGYQFHRCQSPVCFFFNEMKIKKYKLEKKEDQRRKVSSRTEVRKDDFFLSQ